MCIRDRDIAEVEHEVNVAISKNIPIEVTYPSRDELAPVSYTHLDVYKRQASELRKAILSKQLTEGDKVDVTNGMTAAARIQYDNCLLYTSRCV